MTLLLLASIAFGALRVAGFKSLAFQALAHLYVGGMFGAAAANKPHRTELLVQGLILSLVEAACFGADHF